MKKYRVILEQSSDEFESRLNMLFSRGYVLHTAFPSSDTDGLDYYTAVMELPNSEGTVK